MMETPAFVQTPTDSPNANAGFLRLSRDKTFKKVVYFSESDIERELTKKKKKATLFGTRETTINN